MNNEIRINCVNMSEYNARKRLEKLYKIDRFYYSRNLPLIKRFVNVCFMYERSAINFLNEDKKWKQKFGWLVEWKNKQREEERANNKRKLTKLEKRNDANKLKEVYTVAGPIKIREIDDVTKNTIQCEEIENAIQNENKIDLCNSGETLEIEVFPPVDKNIEEEKITEKDIKEKTIDCSNDSSSDEIDYSNLDKLYEIVKENARLRELQDDEESNKIFDTASESEEQNMIPLVWENFNHDCISSPHLEFNSINVNLLNIQQVDNVKENKRRQNYREFMKIRQEKIEKKRLLRISLAKSNMAFYR